MKDQTWRKFKPGEETEKDDRHPLHNLQATASAADPSGIRRIDAWIQSAQVSSVSSAGQIIGRPVVVRQLDSVINRTQQFRNEEWHSDLEVNILSNLASIKIFKVFLGFPLISEDF